MTELKNYFESWQDNSPLIKLPFYSGHQHAGSIVELLEKQCCYIKYKENDFLHYGVPKKSAIVVEVGNEVMIQNIKPGWLILVDTSNNKIKKESGDYVLLLNNKLEIRNITIYDDQTVRIFNNISEEHLVITIAQADLMIVGTPEYFIGGKKTTKYAEIPIFNHYLNGMDVIEFFKSPGETKEFNLSLVKSWGSNVEKVIICKMLNDAMSPILGLGMHAIVDLSDRSVKDGKFSLIRINGQLEVRKLCYDNQKLVIACENENYTARILAEEIADFEILGKCVSISEAYVSI